VTQATIVRKLSSYAGQNQTKKALWELDNIRRTIHILDFIDDPVLRQSVQKALNRGETNTACDTRFPIEFWQVPGENRSGTAGLERVLAAHR
jgi:TnpA family transposase